MLVRSPSQPSFKKGDHAWRHDPFCVLAFVHRVACVALPFRIFLAWHSRMVSDLNTSDVVSLSCALLALELPISSKATTNAKSDVPND